MQNVFMNHFLSFFRRLPTADGNIILDLHTERHINGSVKRLKEKKELKRMISQQILLEARLSSM